MNRGGLVRVAIVLGASTGCSKALPVGGLVVLLRSDHSLDPEPDTLRVEVDPLDGGAPYGDGSYALARGAYSLPLTFAIDSNGDPRASVRFTVTVSTASSRWGSEALRYEVDGIPSDSVAQLDVVFRAACASGPTGDGGSGQACCPGLAEGCRWDGAVCRCTGAGLPAFPSDAGVTTLPPPDGSPDATLPPADGSSDTTIDSDFDGGAPAPADAAVCEAGANRCADLATPERCGTDGQWQDGARCQDGFTYCSGGACIPVPASCVGSAGTDCASDEVRAGTFLRGNDPMHPDAGAPATISAFRLDTYEVEVWRFRGFVRAVEQGTGLPDAGDGKHAHLDGGKGLNGGSDAGVETGWDSA